MLRVINKIVDAFLELQTWYLTNTQHDTTLLTSCTIGTLLANFYLYHRNLATLDLPNWYELSHDLHVDKMYLFTFLWYSAKKIPYIAFIQWGFIAENLISLCSNKPTGNSSYRWRGRDTKVSRRWSQENNRGFVLGREVFAASSLDDGFRATVKQQESRSLVWLYGESALKHHSTSLWISLSVSSQTIRVCSFQDNKRKKD